MPENRVADASATLWGTFMSRVAEFACLAALSLAGTTAAQDFVSVSPDGGTGSSSSRAEPRPELAVVAPVRADPAIACANRNADPQQCRFHWRSALKQSALFLAIQHGGNAIGEGSVRRSFSRGPFFRRYAQALEHYRFSRWSDDDPFLVDYVAHPMMGAVVARIQVQNEPRALSQEVSGRATYWRSRLHALGWATLYAFQWELGPISESSIGNTGSFQYWSKSAHHLTNGTGVTDLVTTPIAGTAFLIGEDILDRYAIHRLESISRNPAWLLAISVLNPSRSAANLLRWKSPWFRDGRAVRAPSH